MTEAALSAFPSLRVGYGEDAHRLVSAARGEGRPLILGGVVIEGSPLRVVAHSDGDAALHALADALLSGVAAGDIGQYFPDTDAAHAGLDSAGILQRALAVAQERGYQPLNVALVVTLDQPKLGPKRSQIASHVARLLGLNAALVGLSFKTSEGLAPQHVQARATVLLRRIQAPEVPAPEAQVLGAAHE